MLKKVISYIFIVFGLLVLWASTSRKAMQYISDKRDNGSWWGTYRQNHGDLVSMCYLDFVQAFKPPKRNYIDRAAYNDKTNTVMYLFGDSYARHLADSAFAGVSNYIYTERTRGGHYHLDKSKRNILLIEISERYVRDYFKDTTMLNSFSDGATFNKTALFTRSIRRQAYASVIPDLELDGVVFNKYINQNLQGNLFNYNFIMPMFESKAALNYYVFNRASGDVVISKDRSFLFLKETVSADDIGSSYVHLNSDDINRVVNNLNIIYAHYKAAGFNEVYFSIIPNSATIVQPQGYNDLIPLVQNSPNLKMNIIDIYSVFKGTSQVYYMAGDTHWNSDGRQQWLNLVNKKLVKLYNDPH